MHDDFILQATGLTKEFKGFAAVHDVSLSVMRGHTYTLLGPNGAGKTALAVEPELILMDEPTQGMGREDVGCVMDQICKASDGCTI